MTEQLPPYIRRIILGTDMRTQALFTISGKPLEQHKLITGTTGYGKSMAIASQFVQLINEGYGCSLIDPHSDTADNILKTLLATGLYQDKRAFERVWYVQFNREDAHIAFNILKQPYTSFKTASLLVEAWVRAWPELEEGAASLKNIVLYAAYVLAATSHPITNFSRLVSDRDLRENLLQQVTDPEVLQFFRSRFDTWSSARSASLTESSLRRSSLLLFEPALRFSLGQRDNKLDFRYIMDHNITVLYDLGGLDPQTQRFLGCLITLGYEMAAKSRVNTSHRPQHFLFIDEFASFVDQSSKTLEHMMTECRKYNLTLTLACQILHQARELKDALQNCLWMTFHMGVEDSQAIAPAFMDYSSADETQSWWDQLGQLFTPSQKHSLVSDSQKRQEWAQLIRTLKPQEFLIHISGKTFQLRSLDMPEPQLARGALAKLKDKYATLLLTPREQMQEPAAQEPETQMHKEEVVIDLPTVRLKREVTLPASSSPQQRQGSRRRRTEVPPES